VSLKYSRCNHETRRRTIYLKRGDATWRHRFGINRIHTYRVEPRYLKLPEKNEDFMARPRRSCMLRRQAVGHSWPHYTGTKQINLEERMPDWRLSGQLTYPCQIGRRQRLLLTMRLLNQSEPDQDYLNAKIKFSSPDLGEAFTLDFLSVSILFSMETGRYQQGYDSLAYDGRARIQAFIQRKLTYHNLIGWIKFLRFKD
jgi:hypothetical protein